MTLRDLLMQGDDQFVSFGRILVVVYRRAQE